MTAIARPSLPPALRHQVWNISIWLLLIALVVYLVAALEIV